MIDTYAAEIIDTPETVGDDGEKSLLITASFIGVDTNPVSFYASLTERTAELEMGDSVQLVGWQSGDEYVYTLGQPNNQAARPEGFDYELTPYEEDRWTRLNAMYEKYLDSGKNKREAASLASTLFINTHDR